MNEQTSRFVDAARGLAAAAVLFTHVEAAVLVGLADIPAAHRGVLAYAAWLLYGFAHQAVVVFFVLSGFLIGGGVLTQASRGKRFFKTYVVDRTVRIYVVLAPALALTAALDALGRQYFGATGIYDLPVYADRSGLPVLLANLANLQDIYAPYFGTNSALWTLSHEYWYYITFGLFGVFLSSGYSRFARHAALAAAIALVAFMSASLSYHLFGFGLWLLGVVAARFPRALMGSARDAAFAFLAVSLGIRLGVRYSLIEIWWIGGLADAIVALAFANLLLALRFDASPLWRFSSWRGHTFLSQISYSLYAVHLPIVVFLCAAAQRFFGFGWHSAPVDNLRWALMAAILVGAAGIARLFWRATEANTQGVRAFVHRAVDDAPRTIAGAGDLQNAPR